MGKILIAGKRKPWFNPIQSGKINFLEYLSDDEKEKFVEKAVKDYEQSRDWRQPYRSKWLRFFQLLNGIDNVPRADHQSKYFINLAREFKDTVLPRAMAALYDTRPLWNAIPRSEEEREEAVCAEKLLDCRVDGMGLYQEHYNVFSDCLDYGAAWMKCFYNTSRNYTGPQWTWADIFSIFPDPHHCEPAFMRYIIERIVMHKDEIKANEDAGLWSGVDKALENTSPSNNYFNNLDREAVLGVSGSTNDLSSKDYHEVQEYWGKYEAETGEVFDIVANIVDRKHLVRMDETPYYLYDDEGEYWYAEKPLLLFRHIPGQGQIYGTGLIELAESHMYQLNDIRNLTVDSLIMALSPVYTALASMIDMPLDSIALAPGEIIPLNSNMAGDPLKALNPHTGFQFGYGESEKILREARAVTGVTETISGVEGNIRATATEVAQRVEQGLTRIGNFIKFNALGPLKEQARITLALDRQYTDEEVLVSVFSGQNVEAWMRVTPSKMKFRGDVRLQVASMFGAKAVKAQQAMAFMEIISQSPQSAAMVDMSVLLKYIADALELPADSLIVKPPTPVAAGLPGLPAGLPGVSNPTQGGNWPVPAPAPGTPPSLQVLQGGASLPTGNGGGGLSQIQSMAALNRP